MLLQLYFLFSISFHVTPKGNLLNNFSCKVESNEVCSFLVFPFYVTPKGNLLNNLSFKVESNEVCSFLFTKLIPDCL